MGTTGVGPPRKECTVVELDGRISVYSPADQTVHSLNRSASAVWLLLDGSRTLGEILSCLHREYELPVDDLRADVEGIIDDLQQRGLLEGT